MAANNERLLYRNLPFISTFLLRQKYAHLEINTNKLLISCVCLVLLKWAMNKCGDVIVWVLIESQCILDRVQSPLLQYQAQRRSDHCDANRRKGSFNHRFLCDWSHVQQTQDIMKDKFTKSSYQYSKNFNLKTRKWLLFFIRTYLHRRLLQTSTMYPYRFLYLKNVFAFWQLNWTLLSRGGHLSQEIKKALHLQG